MLVHQWTDPELVAAIGHHRAAGGRYRLLFHDTHDRSVTRPDTMAGYRLQRYDGVLAFGEVIRRRYLDQGWAERAWTWHEAADHRVFRPLPVRRLEGDLVQALPGIPAIRVFEALACGIPLICSPWEDQEGLFAPGRDFLIARDGGEMRRLVRALMTDASAAKSLAAHGRRTVLRRHTCVHRVNELLEIVAELNRTPRGRASARAG